MNSIWQTLLGLGAIVAGAVAIDAGAAYGVTYDANADFVAFENANSGAVVPNVNGVWSYGTRDNVTGDLSLIPLPDHTDGWGGVANLEGFFEADDTVPVVAVNTSSSPLSPCCGITAVDPSQIWMHPDPGTDPQTYAVVRFTAPTAGAFSATGLFEQLHASQATIFLVANGVQLDDGLATSGAGTTLTGSGSLLAGETLDFVVGPQPSGDYGSTSTGLTGSIEFTPIPEPASISLIILGAALLRRRQLRS